MLRIRTTAWLQFFWLGWFNALWMCFSVVVSGTEIRQQVHICSRGRVFVCCCAVWCRLNPSTALSSATSRFANTFHLAFGAPNPCEKTCWPRCSQVDRGISGWTGVASRAAACPVNLRGHAIIGPSAPLSSNMAFFYQGKWRPLSTLCTIWYQIAKILMLSWKTLV